MIGANIKRLRLKHEMTQKNLADKLFVSAQAVSRWENDEVEPSIGTILELAKIFDVTADEILGLESKEIPEQALQEEKNEKIYQTEASPRQFLAVCEECNSPIYESEEIVRIGNKVLCSKCHQSKEEKNRSEVLRIGRNRRIRAFIFAPVVLVLSLFATFSTWDIFFTGTELKIAAIMFSISMFTFVACCFLNNNFVGLMSLTIAKWSIKFPMLLFTFDVDGCLWFIGMKLLSIILGIIIGFVMFVLALVIGGAVSLFVFPYAIITNIKHPEKSYF